MFFRCHGAFLEPQMPATGVPKVEGDDWKMEGSDK
jgi:hypothetical protein